MRTARRTSRYSAPGVKICWSSGGRIFRFDGFKRQTGTKSDASVHRRPIPFLRQEVGGDHQYQGFARQVGDDSLAMQEARAGEREDGVGEVVVCKSNVEHWLKVLEDGSQDLQIFSPRRDDLMEFLGAYISV